MMVWTWRGLDSLAPWHEKANDSLTRAADKEVDDA